MFSVFVLRTGIRDRRAGYVVSVVKAGMAAAGLSAGPVRPALIDLTRQGYDSLSTLIARVPAV
ncbi:hypothetical protein [Streptomyces sp. NPDC007206]|uniref:hypothetical protein n=1 Tax=Streptomyces sp. NPDC007206 TaxID=3154317 RepID=UPI0034109095